jgi:hypothetical protein
MELGETGLPTAWVMDLETGDARKVSPEDGMFAPTEWLPDGRLVLVELTSFNSLDFSTIEMHRGAAAKPLFEPPLYPPDPADETHPNHGLRLMIGEGSGGGEFSRDGAFLVFTAARDGRKDNDIFCTPVTRQPGHKLLVGSIASEINPRFSPDVSRVAYQSDETGRAEVYVIPFDPAKPPDDTSEAAAKSRAVQVSKRGGKDPLWSADGKSLFFQDADDWLFVSELSTADGSMAFSEPRKLFKPEDLDVSGSLLPIPNDERLLFIRDDKSKEGQEHIDIVLNWTSELDAAGSE